MKKEQVPILIIGAGLAGIAAAIRLSAGGKRVIVLEKNETFGGKLGEWQQDNFRFDTGPSLFTLPEEVDALFKLCGENPRDHFNYVKHNSSCQYFFPDGTSIRLSAHQPTLTSNLKTVFSPDLADKVLRYVEDSKRTYEQIGTFFTNHPRPSWNDVLKKQVLVRYPSLLSDKMRKTLHRYNKSRLRDRRLIQLFDRFGTYNGSNPYAMSGLFSMVSHLEMNHGTFFPVGGMRQIAMSLYDLALRQGVEFHFDQLIKSVLAENNGFLIEANQNFWQAEKLICAIDHLTFYRDLIKDESMFKKYAEQERSTSALVFYWGITGGIPELDLHNILFSADYKHEFHELFELKAIPSDPTIYIHVSSVLEPTDAPAGSQNWFVMLNMSAGTEPSSDKIDALRKQVFTRIQTRFRFDVSAHISVEKIWTRKGIEKDTGSFMGALYGAASNGMLAPLKRHGNSVKKYPGLYFCGGTVHPGGGIPLVLKSAKIVSELIHD